MGNLLHAGLSRLVRSRAFLLALLAELAYTALVVMVCWDHYAAGTGNYTLESILTSWATCPSPPSSPRPC